MVTIYNYTFIILEDYIVTVFELLNHIHNNNIFFDNDFNFIVMFFWIDDTNLTSNNDLC